MLKIKWTFVIMAVLAFYTVDSFAQRQAQESVSTFKEGKNSIVLYTEVGLKEFENSEENFINYNDITYTTDFENNWKLGTTVGFSYSATREEFGMEKPYITLKRSKLFPDNPMGISFSAYVRHYFGHDDASSHTTRGSISMGKDLTDTLNFNYTYQPHYYWNNTDIPTSPKITSLKDPRWKHRNWLSLTLTATDALSLAMKARLQYQQSRAADDFSYDMALFPTLTYVVNDNLILEPYLAYYNVNDDGLARENAEIYISAIITFL